ncbi:hypothetical protein R3P38DRAFT_3275076 [Favolaschia claudopus]|uniref:Fungal STAND N-terminal Goodbye domain-containing protein n=1 Tax=Favolaschia claudopus TaxID=2862362 RepID=A0AAW0AWT5_9AGAR
MIDDQLTCLFFCLTLRDGESLFHSHRCILARHEVTARPTLPRDQSYHWAGSSYTLLRSIDTPSAAIEQIWQQALDIYKEKTGIDLGKEQAERYRRLAECDSSEKALQIIDEFLSSSSLVESTKWSKTRKTIGIIFKVILIFNDAAAELAASCQIPGGKAIFVAVGILIEAVYNMQDRLNALAKLLGTFEQFFLRLNLRDGIGYPVHTQEIFAKICAEFLNVLAVARTIFGDPDSVQSTHFHWYHAKANGFPAGFLYRFRRTSVNFWKALRDNEDIKSAACELDRLTLMEHQMTAAEILQIVANNRAILVDVQERERRTFSIITRRWERVLAWEAVLEDVRSTGRSTLSAVNQIAHASVSLPLLKTLPPPDVITFVDVTGERRPMHINVWKDREAFVTTLKEYFVSESAVSDIIECGQYRIQDEACVVYHPGDRYLPPAGATLFMTVMEYRERDWGAERCPWCNSAVPFTAGQNYEAAVTCTTCGRTFSVSISAAKKVRVFKLTAKDFKFVHVVTVPGTVLRWGMRDWKVGFDWEQNVLGWPPVTEGEQRARSIWWQIEWPSEGPWRRRSGRVA